MVPGSSENTVQPLVQTKMDRPQHPVGMVERAALLARLQSSQEAVVLIDAPAGWGKTSLVAAWMNVPSEHRAFAFVRLGSADNDTRTFWSYVIAALERIDPSLAPDVEEGLNLPGIDPTRSVIPLVVNAIREWGAPIALVMDDYHLITESDVHRSIDFLIENAPSNLTLVLSTRFDPPLQLQQHRVRGHVMELRSTDLRLDTLGTQQMFADRFGIEIGTEAARALCDKTEGWPAGVQLAALSCASDRDPESFIASFSGTDRNVVDYLTSEVLSRLPTDSREFLLQTSILDEFSPELCDALTGSSDSADRLDALERDAMFLVPLDTERQWFRYHHLFGGWLRHTLNRTSRETIPKLHRDASSWYAAHGLVDAAIDHAIAAGDIESAAAQINAYLLALPFISNAPVQRWSRSIPKEIARQHAAIVVAQMFSSVTNGDAVATQRWASNLDEALLGEPDQDHRRVLSAYGRLHRGTIGLFGGNPSSAEEQFRAISSEFPVGSHLLGSWARGMLGIALFTTTGPEEAIDLLIEAAETRRRLSVPDGGTTSILAAAYAELGCWPEADDAANEALAANPEIEGLIFPLRMPAHYALAQVLDHRGQTDAAIEQMNLGLREARRWPIPGDTAWGCLLMSRIAREPKDKRRYLDEAAQLGGHGRFVAQIALAQQRLAADVDRAGSPAPGRASELTPRELDVLRLMRSDLTMREISNELYVSYNTVKGYSKTIYQKLAASSRAEAVTTAVALGLL